MSIQKSNIKYVVRPKLNKIIKERGLTQMKLADLSGVPQGSISRFDNYNEEKNQARYEIKHLIAISKALNLSIEELFEIEITDNE